MIECPIIWLVAPAALLATILISWWLATSGKLENSLLVGVLWPRIRRA